MDQTMIYGLAGLGGILVIAVVFIWIRKRRKSMPKDVEQASDEVLSALSSGRELTDDERSDVPVLTLETSQVAKNFISLRLKVQNSALEILRVESQNKEWGAIHHEEELIDIKRTVGQSIHLFVNKNQTRRYSVQTEVKWLIAYKNENDEVYFQPFSFSKAKGIHWHALQMSSNDS